MSPDTSVLRLDDKLPFLTHVYELRRRLLIWFSLFILFSFVGYSLHTYLLSFLIAPLKDSLYYTSPTGGIEIALKISVIFGFLISLPILFYEVLRFIQPAFSKQMRKHILMYTLISLILLGLGVSFSYFFLLPASLYFLTTFNSTDEIKSLITVNEYFSFILLYLVGFGIIFQLPLVMLIIHAVTPLSAKKLLSYIKFVIPACFILAAIITPTPDVLNMLFLALPLLFLYLVSLIPIWLLQRKK